MLPQPVTQLVRFYAEAGVGSHPTTAEIVLPRNGYQALIPSIGAVARLVRDELARAGNEEYGQRARVFGRRAADARNPIRVLRVISVGCSTRAIAQTGRSWRSTPTSCSSRWKRTTSC